MGMLHSWFGLDSGKDLLVIIGLVCMLVPFLFIHKYKDPRYRLTWFAALLIWMVIFNHKAESPTFIIAFTGIALWVFGSHKTNFLVLLAILAFVFTSLVPTDIFPLSLRKNFLHAFRRYGSRTPSTDFECGAECSDPSTSARTATANGQTWQALKPRSASPPRADLFCLRWRSACLRIWCRGMAWPSYSGRIASRCFWCIGLFTSRVTLVWARHGFSAC